MTEIITTKDDEIIKFKKDDNTYAYYNKDYHRKYYQLHKNDDKICNYCDVVYKAGLKHKCEKKQIIREYEMKGAIIEEGDSEEVIKEKKRLRNYIYQKRFKEGKTDKRIVSEEERIKKQTKFDCEDCGGCYTYSNKCFHMKTLKHISALREKDLVEMEKLKQKLAELELNAVKN